MSSTNSIQGGIPSGLGLGFVNSPRDRAAAYQTGFALQSHIDSAHRGILSENCPACMELSSRLRESAE